MLYTIGLGAPSQREENLARDELLSALWDVETAGARLQLRLGGDHRAVVRLRGFRQTCEGLFQAAEESAARQPASDEGGESLQVEWEGKIMRAAHEFQNVAVETAGTVSVRVSERIRAYRSDESKGGQRTEDREL